MGILTPCLELTQVYKHIATIWKNDEKEDSFFAKKWKVTKFYKTFYKEKVESFLNFEEVDRKELEAIQINVQNKVGDTHLQHIVGELKE